ncbi:hypothetical protein [Bacillus phage vB_BceS-M2]
MSVIFHSPIHFWVYVAAWLLFYSTMTVYICKLLNYGKL